jgi:hypothetical protein
MKNKPSTLKGSDEVIDTAPIEKLLGMVSTSSRNFGELERGGRLVEPVATVCPDAFKSVSW